MIDVQSILAPKSSDIPYTEVELLKIGLIFHIDSYKFAHPFAYRKGIMAMTSYGTARVPYTETIVPFGFQMHAKRYLTQRITMADIDAAEKFAELHFGRKLFARKAWEKVVEKYKGYLPLVIRAIKEGTPIPGGLPIYSVTCFDEDLFWMTSAFETMLLRAVWYPTTIVTFDRQIKLAMKQFYVDTGADLAMLPFALHCFGARGVSCAEQAEVGGAARLVNYMGSDTVEGILAANFYYREAMAAFSVYATEHSVECSFGSGSEDEFAYIEHQIDQCPRGSIVSIVIDGYDTMRATAAICSPRLRDKIIASGVKVVLRPDSGDMMIVVPKILFMLDKAFGHTVNKKGFKKLNYVGIIQGDGVDHLAIKSLLGHLMSYGWAADAIMFGSGGALLQKVNRDSFKFAQKASAILVMVNGVPTWVGTAKDPITDPGKKSKEGLMTTVRNKETNVMSDFRLDETELPDELEDMHTLVYHTGTLYNETNLAEVRERCAV